MAQDTIQLTLETRDVLGKEVKHLRSEGHVPAVIHDHGKVSLHVQGDAVAMLKVWKAAGKHHPIELKAGNKDFVVMIKDAQFDPRKHLLTHVVFNAVNSTQTVEAEVPIRPPYAEGNESSPAERNGLIVLTQLESVEIKALASKLPEVLEYDAEKLVEVGDHLTVADLIVGEGVEVQTDAAHSVATVYEPSAIAAANEAEGGEAEAAEPAAEGEETPAEGAGEASETQAND